MTFAPQKPENVGTIDSVISRSIIRRVYNDGDRTYLTLQQESRNSTPITQQSTAIIIPLTNPNMDFVQFDKSFITIKMRVTFHLTGWTGTGNAADDATMVPLIQYFVGFKNSSDALGEYAIYHKGKQVSGTLQSNATVESFLYHTFRSESDLIYRPNEHSVGRLVKNEDELSMCGTTITLGEIEAANQNNNSLVTKDFNFNIHFNDILPFQQFRSYPAALFGDLEIRFKINLNAFVVLQCDPEQSIKKYMEQNPTAYHASEVSKLYGSMGLLGLNYTKDFTQVRDTFTGIIHAKLSEETDVTDGDDKALKGLQKFDLAVGNQCVITPQSMVIEQVHAILTGYKAHPDALEQMRAKFMTMPWVKFSQNVTYLPFSQKPDTNGFNHVIQTYLNNTTDLILLFPTSENEAQGTVFKNPMLTDLTLTALNRRYPETGLDTQSPEYLSALIGATDTFNRTPNPDLVNSVSKPRWDRSGQVAWGEDRTSFVCSIKVERPSAMGLICDGLDSKGYQVPIRLQAKRKFTEGAGDQYCGRAANMPPPVLVTVNDAYWIFNAKDGGQCIYSNRPFNETVDLFMSQ